LTQHAEEGIQTPERSSGFNSAMDSIQAYNIVKEMLVNNSLPISKGTTESGSESVLTRKLIIDKKILLNLLIDLQRFRKLLFLHKKFFIFQITYDGK
jgi:hypothetical protein